MENIKLKTTEPNERLSFNDWVKEFNVSSRFIPKPEKPTAYAFNVDVFMKNQTKKK